jgi:hypothetical protein
VSEGRVVGVLGYSRRQTGELHPICAARLAHAQRLADGARAVVFSGFSEAEAMRAAWTGPEVLLVCDPEARSTAENAANIAAVASELGARELVIVTSPWHRARARILVGAALRDSGIQVSIEAAEGSRPLLLFAREAGCFAFLPFQLRRARRGKGGRPEPPAPSSALPQ